MKNQRTTSNSSFLPGRTLPGVVSRVAPRPVAVPGVATVTRMVNNVPVASSGLGKSQSYASKSIRELPRAVPKVHTDPKAATPNVEVNLNLGLAVNVKVGNDKGTAAKVTATPAPRATTTRRTRRKKAKV